MLRRLEHKNILITGASGGIGRATALLCARKGGRLILSGRRLDALQAVQKEVLQHTDTAVVIEADIAAEGGGRRLVQDAERHIDRIDMIVCCAGQYSRAHTTTISMEALRASMDLNFFGTMEVVLTGLQSMLRRGQGQIVVVSSVDGKISLPMDAMYCAGKHALAGMLAAMRQDIRDTGIVLTTVLPGRVATPMIDDLDVPWVSGKIRPEGVARVITASLIRGRRGEVVVPRFSSRAIMVAGAISSRLSDALVRVFRLEGKPAERTASETVVRQKTPSHGQHETRD